MSNKPHTGNIELHINELVLHGFPRSERQRLGEAVRQELLRLLTEQGIPDALTRQGHLPRLNAGAIQAAQSSKPERMGRQVAQAVYGSVATGQLSAGAARQQGDGVNTQLKNSGSGNSQ